MTERKLRITSEAFVNNERLNRSIELLGDEPETKVASICLAMYYRVVLPWFDGLGFGLYHYPQWIIHGSLTPEDWKFSLLISGNVGLGSFGPGYGASLGVRMRVQ